MAATATSPAELPSDVRRLYDRLEERILARDQVGASEAYYGLVKADRPLPEIGRASCRERV